jgi:hypothetical protein
MHGLALCTIGRFLRDGDKALARFNWGSLIIFGALTLTASTACAAENGPAGWIGVNVRVPFAERYAFQLLTQPRLFENPERLRVILLRPSFGAALPRGFAVGLGYDGLLAWNPLKRQEHRIWQEGFHRHDFDRLWTLARFRLEQRFFSANNLVSVRGRFLLGVGVKLGKAFELLVNNEFLVNFNDVPIVGERGYSENRVYGGFSRRFAPWVQAALGYQMQWIDAGLVDLINHTVLVLVSFEIPQKQD